MAYLACDTCERYSYVRRFDWVFDSSFELEFPPTSGNIDATYLKNS
jgi:hypothetical protein